MKKILLIAVAAFMLAAPLTAQSSKGVNVDSYLKRIEKSDGDIANEKKNGKPAAWLNRGDLFAEIAVAPTLNLFRGMDEGTLREAYGDPNETTTETLDNVAYTTYVYDDFRAALNAEGLVAFWIPTTVIVENPLQEAYRSYLKAYELDSGSGTANKVKAGIETMANELKKQGDNYFARKNYKQTADDFSMAYEILLHPAVGADAKELNSLSYNAGQFYVLAYEFPRARKFLDEALAKGYEEDGDIYFFLYFAYYGNDMEDRAVELLEQGVKKYPNNPKLIERLVEVYNDREGYDPRDIIPLVQNAIDMEPGNHLLWGGLGGIYLHLKDYDKAAESFGKAVELSPNDFVNNYRLGYLHVEKANDILSSLNEGGVTSYEDSKKVQDQALDEFEKSLPALEKAHQLDPDNAPTIKLLKSITFRLRERPGIGEKNAYYDELSKKLQ